MGKSNHTFPKFVAKRKFWIEWEFLFETIPTEKEKAALDARLRKYIGDYLDSLFNKKYKPGGAKSMPGIPDEIAKLIEKTLGISSHSSSNGKSIVPDVLLEYHQWNEKEGTWEDIPDSDKYAEIQAKISDAKGGSEKLSFTVYTKRWIDILRTEWTISSGNSLVKKMPHILTYRGWFEGKNKVRISDDQDLTAGKGTMNPPPPPPPPSSSLTES